MPIAAPPIYSIRPLLARQPVADAMNAGLGRLRPDRYASSGSSSRISMIMLNTNHGDHRRDAREVLLAQLVHPAM